MIEGPYRKGETARFAFFDGNPPTSVGEIEKRLGVRMPEGSCVHAELLWDVDPRDAAARSAPGFSLSADVGRISARYPLSLLGSRRTDPVPLDEARHWHVESFSLRDVSSGVVAALARRYGECRQATAPTGETVQIFGPYIRHGSQIDWHKRTPAWAIDLDPTARRASLAALASALDRRCNVDVLERTILPRSGIAKRVGGEAWLMLELRPAAPCREIVESFRLQGAIVYNRGITDGVSYELGRAVERGMPDAMTVGQWLVVGGLDHRGVPDVLETRPVCAEDRVKTLLFRRAPRWFERAWSWLRERKR